MSAGGSAGALDTIKSSKVDLNCWDAAQDELLLEALKAFHGDMLRRASATEQRLAELARKAEGLHVDLRVAVCDLGVLAQEQFVEHHVRQPGEEDDESDVDSEDDDEGGFLFVPTALPPAPPAASPESEKQAFARARALGKKYLDDPVGEPGWGALPILVGSEDFWDEVKNGGTISRTMSEAGGSTLSLSPAAGRGGAPSSLSGADDVGRLWEVQSERGSDDEKRDPTKDGTGSDAGSDAGGTVGGGGGGGDLLAGLQALLAKREAAKGPSEAAPDPLGLGSSAPPIVPAAGKGKGCLDVHVRRRRRRWTFVRGAAKSHCKAARRRRRPLRRRGRQLVPEDQGEDGPATKAKAGIDG